MLKRLGKMTVLIAAMGAVLALAVPALAGQVQPLRTARVAAAAKVARFASCRARGGFATCVASGLVKHPRSVHVHVTASPDQRITGSWSMVCANGSGAGSSQGTIGGHTPRAKQLRMPYARPGSCTAGAAVSLSGSGRLHVYLTARVRR